MIGDKKLDIGKILRISIFIAFFPLWVVMFGVLYLISCEADQIYPQVILKKDLK